jgi:hypothetical protein
MFSKTYHTLFKIVFVYLQVKLAVLVQSPAVDDTTIWWECLLPKEGRWVGLQLFQLRMGVIRDLVRQYLFAIFGF